MKFFKKRRSKNIPLVEELHDNIFRLEEINYELQREVEHWKKEAEMYKDWWIKVLKDKTSDTSKKGDNYANKNR